MCMENIVYVIAVHFYLRFISMCMENIIALFFTPLVAAVHLHVYGEHFQSRYIGMGNVGSSPCVWRTYLNSSLTLNPSRFISMCMENIPESMSEHLPCPVHLHVYGEHLVLSAVSSVDFGSSPCVWRT